MLLLIDRLKSQSNFSQAEKAIANFMLANLNQLSEMTINTLADNTFCSTATISRFCKKVQCESYSKLKLQLASELNASQVNNTRIEYNIPFAHGSNNEEIAQSLLALSIQTLQDTYNHIDMDKIMCAAQLIKEAAEIDIYASGNSLVTALDLYNKLLWTGKNSNINALRGFHTLSAYSKPKDCVAVIVSYYGSSQHNIAVAKALTSINIPYILLTGPKINPLCINARVTLHAPPFEEFNNKIAPFSSRTALSYIVDLLYSTMFSLDYENNMEAISEKTKYRTFN